MHPFRVDATVVQTSIPGRRLRPLTRGLLTVCLCTVAICTWGCGGASPRKTGKVSGTIKLDGQPLPKAVVTFEDPSQGSGASTAVDGGHFVFEAPLVIGNYKVAVVPPPAPPPTATPSPTDAPKSTVPKKYLQSSSSGLTAIVKEGDNTLDFQLTP